MCKYFSIDGYWKDDLTEFNDNIVKEIDVVDEDEDDSIFYYGLGETDIIDAIVNPDGNDLEFVITSYEEINF